MAYYDFSNAFANLNSGIDEIGKRLKEQRDTEAQLAAFDTWQKQQQAPLGQSVAAPAAQPAGPSLKSLGQGDYFARTASAESAGSDTAKNPNSSATGRYQFLQGTWNGLMKSNPELGLTADGRTDPEQSNRAMRAFTAQNAEALKAKGIDPSDRNLYMAHFLGAGAAPNFINAVQQDPTVPAASLVRPEVVAANKSVFLNQDGTPRSAGEVYARMTNRFGDGSTAVAGASGGQQAPIRVAQAPATSQADLPAEGAAQAQGFAIPGAPQPATRDNTNPQMIRTLLANPATRDVGKALWQQALTGKQFGFQVVGDQLYRTNPTTGQVEPVGVTNPKASLDMEKTRIDIEKGKRELAGEGATPLTPEERKAIGVPENQAAYKTRSGEIKFGPAGTTIKNEPPPAAGYRYVRDAQGNIERAEPIPGSKAAQEAEEAATKKERSDRIKAETGSIVGNALDDIDRLMSGATLPTTGAMGARVASIPGTAAYDIGQALTTVGANISFAQLQQMREASPTGGALGAVSDTEQKLLQNSYAALSQSQSEAQFKTNLGRVRAVFERIVHGRTLTAQERKTGGPMTMERAKGLREEAAQAIANGADKSAVMKRLKEDYGISAEGL